MNNERNTLGLVGFVLSIVSVVCSLGFLSPIATIVCLIALFKKPRGFAIAGLVISLFQLILAIILFSTILAIFVAMLAAIGLSAAATAGAAGAVGVIGASNLEFETKVSLMEPAVVAYYEKNQKLPPTLDQIPNLNSVELTDPWGKRMRYKVTGPTTFTFSSDGADGIEGTSDDLLSVLGINKSTPAPAEGPTPSVPKNPV